MKFFIAILFILLSTAVNSQSNREVMVKVDPSDLVKAFIGNCLQNVGRLDKVESFAKASNFKQIEGDAANMLSPENKQAKYKLWVADKGLGAPYLLGVSEGFQEGKSVSSCTLSNPYISTDAVVLELVLLLNLKRTIFDEVKNGQRDRAWSLNNSNSTHQLIILLTDAKPSGADGVTLALSAIALETELQQLFRK